MRKNKKETIEITSITTTFEKPEPILEPVYLKCFSVIAKGSNNNEYDIIAKQFSNFKVINENTTLPMLEITLEVNEGLVFDILNAGINIKSIIITYENRKRSPMFGMEYNLLYRGFSGLEGDYNSNAIMQIKMYYQITNQTLTENENKLRLR